MMAKKENTKNKGLAAQTTNHETKTTKLNFNDNSAHNQRLKILDWLLEKGSITTTQAREHLDVMHPAGRINELRNVGYLINKVHVDWVGGLGVKHNRVARYILTQKTPVERDNESEAA